MCKVGATYGPIDASLAQKRRSARPVEAQTNCERSTRHIRFPTTPVRGGGHGVAAVLCSSAP